MCILCKICNLVYEIKFIIITIGGIIVCLLVFIVPQIPLAEDPSNSTLINATIHGSNSTLINPALRNDDNSSLSGGILPENDSNGGVLNPNPTFTDDESRSVAVLLNLTAGARSIDDISAYLVNETSLAGDHSTLNGYFLTKATQLNDSDVSSRLRYWFRY